MTATLVRSTLMLVASLAIIALSTGMTETKQPKSGGGMLALIMVALLVANVAAVVICSTLTRPLFAFLPRNEWMSLPGEIVIRASSAICGLWAASILLQCAQNVGRCLCGLSAEPIEWVRIPKKPRHKKSQSKAEPR